MKSQPDLLSSFKQGNVRALSRLISLAENEDPAAIGVLRDLFSSTGKSKVLGITGPPGAGKSTLTNAFIRFLRERKKTVAVVAVDPVSPFTGGALLGDRIRLSDHFNDPGVFIRSLSTRGKLGGLSLATREVVHAIDAFGFDYIIVETVGVGQSEVDIRNLADLTMLVLVPEWGDAIQALKAGILEIGDIFVVHKADREGADRLLTELKNMLHMAGRDENPVLSSSAQMPETLGPLFERVEEWYEASGKTIAERRRVGLQQTAADLLAVRVLAEAHGWIEKHAGTGDNPYQFIVDFSKANPEGSLFKK